MSDRITVIVPTLLHPQRGPLIERAVESVLQQAGVDVRLVLVVNGSQRDTSEFEAREHVRVLRLSVPDLPSALSAGRQSVDTDFYSFLDDDDQLLPGALRTRLDLLRAHPESDLVVTNGIVRGPRDERPFVPDMAEFGEDPLGFLGDLNWLAPGSTLIRASRVPAELFAEIPRYLEWTYLAVRLASTSRILFSNVETFVYNEDAPGRVSVSDAYLLGQPAALTRLLSLEIPGPLRKKLERNRSLALNGIADRLLARRDWLGAWRAHLECLSGRGGLKFLPFTRKLIGLP